MREVMSLIPEDYQSLKFPGYVIVPYGLKQSGKLIGQDGPFLCRDKLYTEGAYSETLDQSKGPLFLLLKAFVLE